MAEVVKKIQVSRRRLDWPESMGRPRKSKDSDPVILSFKAEPELIRALDAEAERMSEEKPGIRYSRSQVVKHLLLLALDAKSKSRSK